MYMLPSRINDNLFGSERIFYDYLVGYKCTIMENLCDYMKLNIEHVFKNNYSISEMILLSDIVKEGNRMSSLSSTL